METNTVTTNEMLFQWVLRFLDTDLLHIREGAWLDLKVDVLRFCDWGNLRHKEITPETLLPVQATVRENYLGVLARENRYRLHPEELPVSLDERLDERDASRSPLVDVAPHWFPAAVKLEVPATTVYIPLGKGDVTPSLINADLSTTFLFALTALLTKLDSSRVLRCPGCAKLFYAEHKRMEYCSARCSNLTRTRRLRAAKRKKQKVTSRKKSTARKEV